MSVATPTPEAKKIDKLNFIPRARRAREDRIEDLTHPRQEILRVNPNPDLKTPEARGAVHLSEANELAGSNFSHSELRQQMVLRNHPLVSAFRNSVTHQHSRGVGQMNLRYTNLKRLVNDLVRSEHEDLTADLAIRVAVRNNLDERNALIVSIAALIHDDGHPPTHHPGANIISHFLPGSDGKGFCHEAMTRALVEGRSNRYLLSLLPGFNDKKFDSACAKGAGEMYLLSLVPGYNSVDFNRARNSGEEDRYLIKLVGFSPLKLLTTPENTQYRDILADTELNIHKITPQEITAALDGKTAYGKFVKELDRLTYLMHDVCGSPGFKPEFAKLTRDVVNQIVEDIIIEPDGFYLRDRGVMLEKAAPFLALVVRHHLYADVSLSPAASLFSAEFDRQICNLVRNGDLSISDFVRMSEGDVLALMSEDIRGRFERGLDGYYQAVCAHPVSALQVNDDQTLEELTQLIASEIDQDSVIGIPRDAFHVCFTHELNKPKKTAYIMRSFENSGDQHYIIEHKKVFKFPPECAVANEALPAPLSELPDPHKDRVFFVVIDREAPAGCGISQNEWEMRIKLARVRLQTIMRDFLKAGSGDSTLADNLFSRACHPQVFSHAAALKSEALQSARQSTAVSDSTHQAAANHAL